MAPRKNNTVEASTVGTTHLRSLGRSAGRKNARICQMIMGVHMTTAILMASEKRKPKPPSVVVM